MVSSNNSNPLPARRRRPDRTKFSPSSPEDFANQATHPVSGLFFFVVEPQRVTEASVVLRALCGFSFPSCRIWSMCRFISVFIVALIATCALAQQPNLPPNQAPPHSQDDSTADQPSTDQPASSDRASDEESSSLAHRVDIAPPKDDAKTHPFSSEAVEEAAPPSDVQEFHPWNPHKAAKDVEVGEFYLKRKNYHAAEDRFREALVYKPNDAIAQYRLGEALEKEGRVDEARAGYEGYLKILPDGPLSQDARKALDRLSKQQSKKDEPK